MTQCDEYDGCYTDPCLNDAVNCSDVIDGTNATNFTCTCADGYTGSLRVYVYVFACPSSLVKMCIVHNIINTQTF